MPIKSEVTAHPAQVGYPKLMEHIPSGCIIVFGDATGGWLVGDPRKNASMPIGYRWNNCSDRNYKDFHGTVVLGDV